MALRSDIFQKNSLSGTTTVRNGFANVTVDIGPYGLAGNLNFIVELRRGSITGEIIAATDPISLVDFSRFISLTPNVTTISEGQDVNFTLLTANVSDGATFFYTANAVVGNITGEDFTSGLSGNVKVYNNIANILLTANNIATVDIETGERFDLQLRLGSISGQVYTTSEVIEILDTANAIDVVGVTVISNTIVETDAALFTIDTTNALGTNSQVLYYTITGNADIYTGQSGSLLVGGNRANLELIADASVLPGEVRSFAVEFRQGSISGPILQTSDTIYVRNAVINEDFAISATGGNATVSGDFITHSFNTSSQLNVIRSGYANILIVAGGGGGGSSNPSQWETGGGGAGGVIYATDYFLPAGIFTITLGGGGASDTNGQNTTFVSPGLSLTAIGGGAGGAGADSGNPGGSGGGGGGNGPVESTALQPLQPGDSGLYGYGSPGRGGAAAYGAGGGGATEISPAPNRWGGNGLPVVMLTEGLINYYGGGGGGSGTAGGLGGGGTGPGLSGAGKVNSGGGGGSSGYNPGNPGGPGGSGVVLVKYLNNLNANVVPKISYVTEVSTAANTYFGDQTITIQVATENVIADETLFYSVNNTSNLQVVGGNTGSFIITSNNYIEVPVTLDISGWSNISMQIRRNSGAGAILGESENLTILERPVSGGTLSEDELYVTHIFTTSGNLVISTGLENPVISNVLLVGGGGGPAFIPSPSISDFTAGGGGGGGFLEKEVILYPGNTYTIVVGAGGFLSPRGGDTSAFGNVAYGGGGSRFGIVNNPPGVYGFGGSGGGAGGLHSSPPGTYPGGTAIQPTYGGWGFNGSPIASPTAFPLYAGGGGGAGGVGGGPANYFMVGGVGRVSSLSPPLYGTDSSNSTTPGGDRYFAGGGGGYDYALSRSVGGVGGGGTGNKPTPGPQRAGAQNTGGGAGASATGPRASSSISAGGSGIVIVRYSK